MIDKAVYLVAVKEGCDVYADMALVSILSLKITNPSLAICLVCDRESTQLLQNAGHRLLGLADEFHAVDTPDGPAAFRHRWIKTQLPIYVRGSAIHLDADTLIRAPLTGFPSDSWEFAAVLDYNGLDMQARLGALPHVKTAQELGWSLDLACYVNGGVFCWHDTASVCAFFAEWHRLWREGFEARQMLLDQPSLNASLCRGLVNNGLLPNTLNTMIIPAWDLAPEAVVWHFWSAGCEVDHSFAHLVGQAKHLSTNRLATRVGRAIRFSRPWPNTSQGLARLLDWRGDRYGYRSFERLWLAGQRRGTLLHLLKATRRRLSRVVKGSPSPGT